MGNDVQQKRVEREGGRKEKVRENVLVYLCVKACPRENVHVFKRHEGGA